MNELLRLLIGIIVLFLGIPVGNILAKYTKEELKSGKIYFKILIWICLFGGLFSLIIQNDGLMFTLFFIAIVTSRSLKEKEKINKSKRSS